MTQSELFAYEMMDTPTLAAECHRLKADIDTETHNLFLGTGDMSYKRRLMAKLKTAKKILKDRQMKLF